MKRWQVTGCALFGIAVMAVGSWGCSPSDAKPLEVTYYYLPG